VQEVPKKKKIIKVHNRHYPVFPTARKVLEMITLWHHKYCPILVDEEFNKWVEYVAPYIVTPFLKRYTINNFSDITFSLIFYPNGVLNLGRFYLGTINLDPDILDKFYQQLLRFVGEKAYKWAKKNASIAKLVGVGMGVDVGAGEKRVYLMYETKCPAIKGLTTDWRGNIIEDKTYCIDHKGRVILKGSRGTRLQVNVQLHGNRAARYIARMPLPDQVKMVALQIVNDGYALDTVSISETRGVALYFD